MDYIEKYIHDTSYVAASVIRYPYTVHRRLYRTKRHRTLRVTSRCVVHRSHTNGETHMVRRRGGKGVKTNGLASGQPRRRITLAPSSVFAGWNTSTTVLEARLANCSARHVFILLADLVATPRHAVGQHRWPCRHGSPFPREINHSRLAGKRPGAGASLWPHQLFNR